MILAESATDCIKCDVIIVYDRRPVGTTPTTTDVFDFNSSCSAINDDNAERFEIVYRKSYVIIGGSGAASTTRTEATAVDCSFLLDLQGRPTVYKANGTGVANDISEGNLLLFLMCDQLAATNNVATFRASIRGRYVDDC